MMACGHAANADADRVAGVDYDPPIPCCVICSCYEQVTGPDLTGRVAVCPYCRTERPSSPDLAFFEYRGEGTGAAAKCAECGYSPVAHDPETPHMKEQGGSVVDLGKCPGYRPRGDVGRDSFYCGCRGWD